MKKTSSSSDRFEEEKKMDEMSIPEEPRRKPAPAPVMERQARLSHSNGSAQPHGASQPEHRKESLKRSPMVRMAGWSLRFILLDLPLTLSFALYLITIGIERIGKNYLIPQIDLQIFTSEKAQNGLTYFHRVCDESDQTAVDPSEFTVTPSMTTNDAVNLMLTHGVSVIPNLLSESTATALRDFILAENAVAKDLLYVIANENRWSFPIRVDQHPTVVAALEEMLNQPHLVEILEAVAGKNPAVIEFTAITQAYGAKQQFWHQDVTPEGNAAKYGRSFIPSYSLFVPLQNVTAKMGATGVCPGTHMCSEGCRDFCERTGFQVSGKADNWPLGAGALVNQQTTHRGEAHLDPNGPHRAVFILTFAPRPQTQPRTIESRLIGVSGSYSLHWSQWGHTLADFQRPLARMKHPWRELRSLGLVKPKGSQWGWDYITVSSGRIANEDTGFTTGDLDSFVETGGFPWLPPQLQGNATDDDNFAWVSTLADTVQKCRKATEFVHRSYLAVYMMFSIVMILIFQRRSTWSSGTVSVACKVVVIHAALLFAGWLILSRAMDSPWGRNIDSLRSFSMAKTLALNPMLPATLPTKQDVMMVEGMKSAYLNSYTRVLDIFQPGNKAWDDVVASLAIGYDDLPPNLQRHVQKSLFTRAWNEDRRLLVQTANAGWAVAPSDMERWFCHKSLAQKSNRNVNAAVESLDFLLTEARYGFWRDSVLHKTFVSKLVASLRDDILGMKLVQSTNVTVSSPSSAARPLPLLGITTHIFSAMPKETRVALKLSRTTGVLSIDTASHPLAKSWMQEGDEVEALFKGNDEEWYRARITQADSNTLTWDVVYDDDDVGYDLCLKCVRAFVPYELSERVEVRTSPDSYAAGEIVAMNKPDSFDVQLQREDKLMSGVSGKDIRRRIPSGTRKQARRVSADKPLTVGMKVEALLPDLDDDEWYPGKITKINSDGKSFAIMFDDGDFAASIPRRYIDVQS